MVMACFTIINALLACVYHSTECSSVSGTTLVMAPSLVAEAHMGQLVVSGEGIETGAWGSMGLW